MKIIIANQKLLRRYLSWHIEAEVVTVAGRTGHPVGVLTGMGMAGPFPNHTRISGQFPPTGTGTTPVTETVTGRRSKSRWHILMSWHPIVTGITVSVKGVSVQLLNISPRKTMAWKPSFT